MEFPENNVRRDTSFFEDLKCFDGKYKYNQHGFCPLGFVLFSLQLDYACSSNFVINFRPNFHEPFYFKTIHVTKFMFFFPFNTSPVGVPLDFQYAYRNRRLVTVDSNIFCSIRTYHKLARAIDSFHV